MVSVGSNHYVGLDMGTSSIEVAVLNGCDTGWKTLGLGSCPAPGIDQADMAIKDAIREAELAAGVPIKSVLAGVNFPDLVVRRAVAGQTLKPGARVNRQDLLQLQRELTGSVVPAGYAMVQMVDLDYYLDGELVPNALGSRGRSIKLEALVVAAPARSMEELQDCLQQAGLKMRQAIAGPLAAAEAVLTAAERELGVVCVDLGAGYTKVAYINHGRLVAMKVFPAGSGHITSDLAMGLHITLPVAETLKIKYGLEPPGNSEMVLPNTVLPNRIITARVEELLGFTRQLIDDMGLPVYPPGGVVLTGGGAGLTGLQKFAENFLTVPVRIGNCPGLTDAMPPEDANRYSTAIGLGLWRCRREPRVPGVRRQPKRGWVKKWL